MNVWAQIDKLQKRYENEFTATSNGVEGYRGIKGSVGTDDLGRWHCRYIPKGERRQETLRAKSGAALVEALKAIRDAEAK